MSAHNARVLCTSVLVLALVAFLFGDVAATQGTRHIPLIRVGMFAGMGLFLLAMGMVLFLGQKKRALTAAVLATSTADDRKPLVDLPLFLAGIGLVVVLAAMVVVVPFTPINREQTVQFATGVFLLVMLFGATTALRAIAPLRERHALALLGGPGFFWTLVGLLSAVHVARIVADPLMYIDVWRTVTHGIETVLSGENPYAMVAPGLANWLQFGPVPEQFQYPPATLFTLAPFYAAFGDYRYAYVFAGLGAAILFTRLATSASRPMAYVLALLLLCWPDTFGKSWTEALMAFFAVWVVYNLSRRPASALTAVSLGLFASQKQYLILLVPQLFTFQKGWSLRGLTALWAGATAIPFVVWDHGLFYQSAIAFHSKTPFRSDGITLAATLSETQSLPWPGWLTLALAWLTSLVTTWLFRRRGAIGFALSASTTLLVLFLFHRYAFANYYQLVFYLLIAATLLLYRDGVPFAEATTAAVPAADRKATKAFAIGAVFVAVVPSVVLVSGAVGRGDWARAGAFVKQRFMAGDAVYLRTASAKQRLSHFEPLPIASPVGRLDDPRPSVDFKRLWVVTHPSRAGSHRPEWHTELWGPRERHLEGELDIALYVRK